jgi:hypothetical protein
VLDGRKREYCEGDVFAIGGEYNFGVVREIELWVGQSSQHVLVVRKKAWKRAGKIKRRRT